MCEQCSEFAQSVRIESPGELDEIVSIVRHLIKEGRMEILAGDLEWQDLIICDLACTVCGQRFHLGVDTYHGRGGKWETMQ